MNLEDATSIKKEIVQESFKRFYQPFLFNIVSYRMYVNNNRFKIIFIYKTMILFWFHNAIYFRNFD